MSYQLAASAVYPQSPDPTLADTEWLQELRHHSIFVAQQAQPQPQPPPMAGFAAGPSSVHSRPMAIRGTELLAVVDNEIRIASLVDAKASVSSYPSSSSPPLEGAMSQLPYKVLMSAESLLNFPIRQLSVNPTGKLLACIGDDQITLVVLPRSGYPKHVDRNITCRTASVGPYYHSPHAESGISKVEWHPWGENATSLLVLTTNGLLREYDVAKDIEEPQQTASFLPVSGSRTSSSPYATRSRSRSRSATPNAASLMGGSSPASRTRHGSPSFGIGLTAEDDDATTAISFSLCVTHAPTRGPSVFDRDADDTWTAASQHGRHPADWSPLTVYGLMKNGDIWAICPFLPRTALVPAAYLHALANVISLKANSINHTNYTPGADMQLRYLNSLLKHTSATGSRRDRSSDSATPHPNNYPHSRSTSAIDLDQLVPSSSNQEEVDHVQDIPVRLHPPSWSFSQNLRHTSKKAPRPQGPFLLKPAPIELCDDRESSACDIAWTWLTKEPGDVSQPEISDAVSGLAALAIVGHDGRVDVGLVLNPVEASWGGSNTSNEHASGTARSTRPAKTNRYGMSDTEEEGDELEAPRPKDRDDLPFLLIYETIDLGLLDTVQAHGVGSSSHASDVLREHAAHTRPCFVRDPLYPDTFYIYHSLGAQCLSFAKWAPKMIEVLNLPSNFELENLPKSSHKPKEGREKALVKLLHHGECTEIVWVVKSVVQGQETDKSGAPVINPVTAVSILSDVYLSYAFLAITQDFQLVSVELSLRVESDASADADPREDELGSTASKGYVSLLGEGTAFRPPAIFQQASGLQGLPSHARQAAHSGLTGEIKITPETLRALGKAVEGYRVEIRDVVSAGNVVQARLDLQIREVTRQLGKLDGIRKRADALMGHDAGSAKEPLESRLQRIAQRQVQLVGRIDNVLQKLMDSHQPSLSIYEKQWFEELQRLAAEAGVSPGAEGDAKAQVQLDVRNKKSLASRTENLAYQLSLLQPQLEALKTQTTHSERGSGAMLGASQLKKVEIMLSAEAALLNEAKEKTHELNRRIARVQPAARGASAAPLHTLGMPTNSTVANLHDFSMSRSAFSSPRRGGRDASVF